MGPDIRYESKKIVETFTKGAHCWDTDPLCIGLPWSWAFKLQQTIIWI